MAQTDQQAFIDGITSIATHNGVHRIVRYKLTERGQPQPSVELLVPSTSVGEFVNAFSRLSR
jgi:hypothetical protein